MINNIEGMSAKELREVASFINTDHGKAYITSSMGNYLKLRYEDGSHGWAERSKVSIFSE